jgi:salicylate hydroxylase
VRIVRWSAVACVPAAMLTTTDKRQTKAPAKLAQCNPMNKHVLIAGGGIGGMGLAVALSRAGLNVDLLEQTPEFSEVGAGIQLGPNAVRVLSDWGLSNALQAVAAFPDRLRVRDAHEGTVLGELPLSERARQKYGQPYATIHRADALQVLLQAAQAEPRVTLHLKERLRSLHELPDGVSVLTETGHTHVADALIGCDGLWSVVRRHVMAGPAGLQPDADPPLDIPPRFSGHIAYRGMVAQVDLPDSLRTQSVTAWLGAKLHVVQYPVRRGELVNVVAVVEGRQLGNPQGWTHDANRAELLQAIGPVHPQLRDLLEAVTSWKQWPLNDRPPMTGPYEHAQGRVALAGDAAHPMRPYLAQGAAMALEDAWTLGRLVQRALAADSTGPIPWVDLFQRYARGRWQRNARVQANSISNGKVFHADGFLRMGRDVALSLMGDTLMDKPWLYSGPPDVV